MQQQMDATQGFNSAPQQMPTFQQQSTQQAAGQSPGGAVPQQGQQVHSGTQQDSRQWESPMRTQHDPAAYRRAIEDALARQQAFTAQVQGQYREMYDPYYDPSYDAYNDPREELLGELVDRYGQWPAGMGERDPWDPMIMAGPRQEELLAELPQLVEAMVERELAERDNFERTVNTFLDYFPSLAGAKHHIGRLFEAGMQADEVYDLVNAILLMAEPGQHDPLASPHPQVFNETFAESGSTAQAGSPISEDDERMIEAAVRQLFGE